ncbi:MAG TPA: hypothetical protein VN258_06785 [Mobilitalea sp.]|nr:hypothetical protein [Mobilitalea sp.]
MIRSRQKNSNSVPVRLGKKIIIILLIISIPAIIFMSTFYIKKVEVVGANRYSADQIKNIVFQSEADHFSLLLYLKYRFFERPKLPFVEKIEVGMEGTHSVTISVYEKMIAGCVEFMGEYLYFDKDGIVVESTSKKLDKVPVIKGLQYKEIILNEKLKVQKEELFDVIINLTKLINKYDLNVDSVSFNSRYEVTINCADITVLLGKRSTYDEQLAELKNILKEAKGMSIILDMQDYKPGMKVIGKPKKSTE